MSLKHKVFDTDEKLMDFLTNEKVTLISTHTTPFKVEFEIDSGESWSETFGDSVIDLVYKVTLIYKENEKEFI
jgi:hypothetical protein